MNDYLNQQAELEARNAAMRENMNSALENLDRQTQRLQQAQQQAASVVGTASSDDGLVTVKVNAAGVITDLKISNSAFQFTTPKKLSELILLTIQEAAGEARGQTEEAFAAVQGDMLDLPDIFPDAPSLKAMIPSAPKVPDSDDDDDDDYDEDYEEKGYY